MEPLARDLRELGRTVVTADTGRAESTEQVTRLYQNAAPNGPAVWVAHSNAGLYLPQILCHRADDVGIFLDASVPGKERPQVSVAGTHLQMLADLANGSTRVPPWTDWWTAEQLKELVPDPQQRERLREACRSLPLAYFSEPIDVPDDWWTIPAGYVSFDGAYVAEREKMADAGWLTRHLPGHHLTPFSDPRPVAIALVEIATLLWSRADQARGN